MVVNIVEAFDEYRAERVSGFLEEAIQPGARVLDCGCGKMRVRELISQELGLEVIGLDVISLVVMEDVYRNGFELALLKLFDWLGNRPFAVEMSLPFTFRSEREWLAQFEKLGVKIARVIAVRPVPWRPSRHRIFILENHDGLEQV